MLIHELTKLRGAKELFDSGDDGSDIDKVLRSDDLDVLCRHTFFDNAFHTAHANTELIKQEFTDSADAAIAKVVDIVA